MKIYLIAAILITSMILTACATTFAKLAKIPFRHGSL